MKRLKRISNEPTLTVISRLEQRGVHLEDTSQGVVLKPDKKQWTRQQWNEAVDWINENTDIPSLMEELNIQHKLMEYAKSVDEEFHDLLWYAFNGVEARIVKDDKGNYQLSMPTKYLMEATILEPVLTSKMAKYKTGLIELLYPVVQVGQAAKSTSMVGQDYSKIIT